MSIHSCGAGALLVAGLVLAGCGDSSARSNTRGIADTATGAPTAATSSAAPSVSAGVPTDAATTAVDTPATARPTPSRASAAAPSDPVAAARAERSARRVVVNGVDLTGIGYDKGSDSAPVVLVNFSDFGCPFCRSFARETEPAIEREYVATGKVFFKYVPFVVGMFPNGQQAARAAECAADQGRFWPMHDRLYAGQTQWKETVYALPVFQTYAAAIGMDTLRFGQCYATHHLHPRTQRASDAADRLGVRVTPSFVVNGRGVEGALPLAQFREVLDAALKESRPSK